MARTVSNVYSYFISLLNINFNGMFNFGYTQLILQNGLDFILVCKPDSHKTLYQWVEELDGLQAVETVVKKR
ncbi:hypothetical protein BuS5_03505 [Desulfosarcina sp. BuS5]|uniref:hypothetical protein n=1 Tax=Desulfosarcina sp. BuS5 TaxID=933262 RepID=UPI002378C12D|nr:hypothetical protein [Desulfosarcina sp. BuS5]WDN90534.1 hypothetical protein BuS5_03505 [Desulfosarcina sp. BuS5]